MRLQLTLDPGAGSDKDLVRALAGALPAEEGLDVSTRSLLSESGIGALAFLGVTAWIGKRVLGPTLDQPGQWLRDLLLAYVERRGVGPVVTVTLQPGNVRIGVPVEHLESLHFRLGGVAGLLMEMGSLPCISDADRVVISAKPAGGWTAEIWPADMAATARYWLYDSESRSCEPRWM